MLLVVEKGSEAEVQNVFDKWDLENAVIGDVTDDGLLSFYMNEELEAQIPANELVLGGGAPQYERPYRNPDYLDAFENFNIDDVGAPTDLRAAARQLVSLPSIANKRWIYHQYDSMVGTVNATTNAPADAAVVLVKETGKGIAVTVDCNSRYVYADPYKGAMIAVAEAARNIVCSGGIPLGVTNCLNFGNPYDPEVYYQFVHAVKGMGDACRKFDTPVTGGNVSFYNQGPEGPVFPTPTIGMVGLVEDLSKKMTLNFKEEGNLIYLLGISRNDISSSQYLCKVCGINYSPAPYFNLEEEYHLQETIKKLIHNGAILSAHDVSEGGLFTALLESCFTNGFGFAINITADDIRKDAFLFGESQSRVIVSVNPENVSSFEDFLKTENLPHSLLGNVAEEDVTINGESWGTISEWKELYDTAIEKHLTKELDSEGALAMI